MANENSHFTSGPGRRFRTVAREARRGADPQFLAPRMIRALRRHLRDPQNQGPTGLSTLTALAGVCSDGGRLPFIASEGDPQDLLDRHERDGLRDGRAPQAACEAQVVRREWARLQNDGEEPWSYRDLVADWCMETLGSVAIGRIEPTLPGTPAERVRQVQAIRRAACEELYGAGADILDRLVQDPSGNSVRVRLPREKVTTGEQLHQPLPLVSQAFAEGPE